MYVCPISRKRGPCCFTKKIEITDHPAVITAEGHHFPSSEIKLIVWLQRFIEFFVVALINTRQSNLEIPRLVTDVRPSDPLSQSIFSRDLGICAVKSGKVDTRHKFQIVIQGIRQQCGIDLFHRTENRHRKITHSEINSCTSEKTGLINGRVRTNWNCGPFNIRNIRSLAKRVT